MYNHLSIEKKWQEKWRLSNLYQTKQNQDQPKYYILDMFPYPSGDGLHVGHPKGYIATDIISRMRLMQGYNVLHPMGWDAFGLPAENYALKNKVHPKIATEKNIKNFKRQLNILGLSYDWEREINTTDPSYYKWTQWIFLQMWRKGLAYESQMPINWCPSCKTGLANEDLENGACERCGDAVEQKPMRQWILKITDYASRLLADLENLSEWEDSIKEMQVNWIGRSDGAEIDFSIKGLEDKITIFTTRVDTIYGCTYLVLAPEHTLINNWQDKIVNWNEVNQYIGDAKKKTDLQRSELNKEKSGIILEGLKAINPFSQQEIPIYIADYVLSSYGSGAIMAVPAHDERDWEFANKYQLPIKQVVTPLKSLKVNKNNTLEEAYLGRGRLLDSGEFSDLESDLAIEKITSYLEAKKLGRKKINYKLKDWVYSRQRYWGEPIPLIHCQDCGVVPVPEKDLPVLLPEVESYEPTGTGESPLATIDSWVNVDCPACGKQAKRETNTMPQWGGSCWYYLRYIDPDNKNALVSTDKEKYWSPVDLYVGGAEHATRHLVYARFWHKFLYDLGLVSQIEPFVKLRHVGLIMGEDGRKMSKRWGNVINPDDVVERFGADALRLYEMFMGPFDQAATWNTNGLLGVRKFLEKVFNLFQGLNDIKIEEDKKSLSLLNKTIKKISNDIESFHFNTAVSAFMILVNNLTDYRNKHLACPLPVEEMKKLLQILSPFAPHLSEELWSLLGEKESIFKSSWPKYQEDLMEDEFINYIVQVNGKLRATLELPAEISEEDLFSLAKKEVAKWLENQEIKKTIFVPKKLVNFVI